MGFIVKNTTFPGLLDLIAPHSCKGCSQLGIVLCDRCKNYIINQHPTICPQCRRTTTHGRCKYCPNLPPIFIAGFRQNLIGQLIHDFKYHSVRALAKPLAQILDAVLPILDDSVIIVPLPTISPHIRERALDHTMLIAKHLAKLRSKQWRVERPLIRNHNTIQVGTDRATRLTQATTAYSISTHFIMDPSATYLLLDDVWTTGASLNAATKKLQDTGITNIAIAVLALS